MNATTLPRLFLEQLARGDQRPAVHFRHDGEYLFHTWGQLADDVGRTALALRELGVCPGDRVLLISPNRYEWIVADLAIQVAGGVHVPVHISLSGAQMHWQLRHCGAKIALLGTPELAAVLAPHLDGSATKLLSFEDCPEPLHGHAFTTLRTLTRSQDSTAGRKLLENAAEAIRPDDLATIIYTSGTTGEPKGVMLSQNNLASNSLLCCSVIHVGPQDVRLTWLPLSHIFARTCDLYGLYTCGYELALAESADKILENCSYYRPHALNGVPYFYEKIMNQILETKTETPGVLQQLFGGRLRVCIAGGAPLPAHVAAFYRANGVFLLQGYGLTESSPVISTETPEAYRSGTVGKVLPELQVKIAPDGEILTKGSHVMLGYWNNPSATSEVLEDDWLATGDLGELDQDGYLKITGRKKELIVTSAGKNIAPVYLESLLKADPLFQQVVVVGDRRKFLTALIVPNLTLLQAWAQEQPLPWNENAAMLVHPRIRRCYAQRIGELLKDVSQHEQIRNFTLLPRPFSVEAEELTLTLKLRRSVIARKYCAQIEAMYIACEDRLEPDFAS
jgi:long-chain acyl-CoA synthetase